MRIYYVRPAQLSESLHFHELVHVVQWKTLGIREFLLTYAIGLAQHGYLHSPLEALAYELQKRFEQGAISGTVVGEVATRTIKARNDAALAFEAHGLLMAPR